MADAGIDRGCGRARSAVVIAEAILEELEWTDDVTAALEHPTSHELLRWMPEQVRRGIAQLWRVRDQADCLYVITRVDRDPLEWTICYVRGSGLLKFAPIFLQLARSKDWPLRMHTVSLVTARLCRKLGFRVAEYVLRCDHGCER